MRAPAACFRRVLFALGIGAALTACANIKNDTARTKTEGTLAGGAGGAILGGVLGGLMSGGAPDAIARGAISGAASGGASGYLYGRSVAYRKKEYATAEAYLDACIAEVEQETAACRQYNAQARRIIQIQQRQIQALQTSHPPGRTEALRENLETNLQNLETGLQHWQIIVEAHKRAIRRTRPDDRRSTLTREVEALERQRAELEQNKSRFLELEKALPR